MPGGYFVAPDPAGGTRHDAPPTATSVTLARIRRGVPPPALTPALRRAVTADLAAWGVETVVLGPMAHRAASARFLTELLGQPPTPVGGVDVWRDARVR
jgi:hypothetical protein